MDIWLELVIWICTLSGVYLILGCSSTYLLLFILADWRFLPPRWMCFYFNGMNTTAPQVVNKFIPKSFTMDGISPVVMVEGLIYMGWLCAEENLGKSILVKKYLGAVAFNNITRLLFGKRFMNSEGIMEEQGLEFKAVAANGLKLGASLTMAEHIPWLRWMFPLEEDAFAKHGARRDRLTRAIIEEHTLARHQTGGAKQHFVDALLTLQHKYDLSEDTIIGLLWVSYVYIYYMIESTFESEKDYCLRH